MGQKTAVNSYLDDAMLREGTIIDFLDAVIGYSDFGGVDFTFVTEHAHNTYTSAWTAERVI